MERKYPNILFESTDWSLRTIHGSKIKGYALGPALGDFAGRDSSFSDALRCLAAEWVLADSNKDVKKFVDAFRLLRKTDIPTLFDLSHADLRHIESSEMERGRANPASAGPILKSLDDLAHHLDRLSAKGIIPRIRYAVKRDVRSELRAVREAHNKRRVQERRAVLDRQIEALCEALNAVYDNDSRLSATDRVSIAMMGMEMCAPSRVNEILCLSIDDQVVLDDYVKRAEGLERDKIHAVHQALIVTMKGSKGAQWSAKPILNFMIDLFNYCLNVVIEHGQRSRTLATWYEKNPDKLYLPPELEYLRGGDLLPRDLAKVIQLREVPTIRANSPAVVAASRALKGKRFKASYPITDRRGRKLRDALLCPWDDVEAYLLARIRERMGSCRMVTKQNFYEGNLSKMLFLFDGHQTPCLPGSIKYDTIIRRLKQTKAFKDNSKKFNRGLPAPTVFEKLGITMPVNGTEQFAYIGTHDPRRWLSTQAMLHRERLSDVLINKWANRLSIAQLGNYDFRTPEQKADIASLPNVVELEELSTGLDTMRKAEEGYGLQTEIVAVHDAGITVTTMDAITAATDNRPVARTSEQLFIIYPSWFGACVHQHHETPCRSYGSCLPCDNNLIVKGHLPTNDRVRKRKELLHRSIVNQMEKLVIAHNRAIPDHPEGLESNLLSLVRCGLDPEQMADDLIGRFHEIKQLVIDVCFRNKLEEAFVATGFVELLDDPAVASGALIKYHNPTRHAAPDIERALDEHGGHAQIERDRQNLIHRFPQFAPTSHGLTDKRSLVASDEDDCDEWELSNADEYEHGGG